MAYINDIQRIDNLTIADIIRVSYQYVPNAYKLRPYAYRDNEGRTLGRGTAILETEEQWCADMAAYGNMHYKKLSRALEDGEFPYRALNNGVEIYRTDTQGTVAFESDGREYAVSTAGKKFNKDIAVLPPAGTKYVINKSSRRFHLPDCKGVPGISGHNKGYTAKSRKELMDEGYIPCGYCKP